MSILCYGLHVIEFQPVQSGKKNQPHFYILSVDN